MIDYGCFRLACPPGVGGGWFDESCRRSGVFPAAVGGGRHSLHDPAEGPGSLSVTLIRHPACWLDELRRSCLVGVDRHVGAFGRHRQFRVGLPLSDFVGEYLRICPGELTSIHGRYSADSVIKIEDCPPALASLLAAVGREARGLAPPDPVRVQLDRRLAGDLRRADRELFDRYDYW